MAVEVEKKLTYRQWMLLDRIRELETVPRHTIRPADWKWLAPDPKEKRDGTVETFPQLASGDNWVRLTEHGLKLLESQPRPTPTAPPKGGKRMSARGGRAEQEAKKRQVELL